MKKKNKKTKTRTEKTPETKQKALIVTWTDYYTASKLIFINLLSTT